MITRNTSMLSNNKDSKGVDYSQLSKVAKTVKALLLPRSSVQ